MQLSPRKWCVPTPLHICQLGREKVTCWVRVRVLGAGVKTGVTVAFGSLQVQVRSTVQMIETVTGAALSQQLVRTNICQGHQMAAYSTCGEVGLIHASLGVKR